MSEKTAGGKELWVLQISKGVQKERALLKPMVKYIANMHGDETVGRELMLTFPEYLLRAYESDYNDDIKNLMHYKKIEIEVLHSQMWPQDDAKAIQVADYDLKSTLAKEREIEFAMGLRTDDDIKELVSHLEKM